MSGLPGVRHHDVCTCARCNAKANRIAAFGAIRRAAEVARQKDVYAEECKQNRKWETAGALQWEAAAIREAIRAAIGSDKA